MSSDNLGAHLQEGLAPALGNEQVPPGTPGTTSPSLSPAQPGANPPALQPLGTSEPQPLWQQLGYNDPEATVQGVWNLRNHASRALNERDEWKEKYEALSRQQQNGDTRALPVDRLAPTDDPFRQLEDTYQVPKHLLTPAIQQAARAEVEQYLRPLMAAAESDAQMVQRYGPQYSQWKPQIEAFVAQDPRLNQMVNAARSSGNPELVNLGNELAVSKFTEAVIASTHQGLQQQAQDTQGAIANSRAHAGVLAGRTAETRNMAQAQAFGERPPITREQVMDMAARGDQRGVENAIESAIRATLPPDHVLEAVMAGRAFQLGSI